MQPKNSLPRVTDFKFGQAKPNTPPAGNKNDLPKEDKVTFPAGRVIFQRGDAGGDLYFIEEGIVEIYTEKDGASAVLSEMKQGEIIGVMTCLTNEPRMASAKAKTAVVTRKVPHDAIKKIVSAMPPWLNIVLKEFTIRLKQINDQYLEASNRIKKLEVHAITKLYTATQLAGLLAAGGDYFARKLDDSRVLFVEEILDKLALMLNRPREELDAILTVFQDSGLLRIELEQERKRKYFSLENAAALSYFPQFVRETRSGPKRRLLKTKFSNKEFRLIMNIVKYTRKKLGADAKTARVTCADLTANLEKATNCPFEADALRQAADLELLAFEGTGPDMALSFAPLSLARTMTCIEAVRRLVILESTGVKKVLEEEEKKEKGAA